MASNEKSITLDPSRIVSNPEEYVFGIGTKYAFCYENKKKSILIVNLEDHSEISIQSNTKSAFGITKNDKIVSIEKKSLFIYDIENPNNGVYPCSIEESKFIIGDPVDDSQFFVLDTLMNLYIVNFRNNIMEKLLFDNVTKFDVSHTHLLINQNGKVSLYSRLIGLRFLSPLQTNSVFISNNKVYDVSSSSISINDINKKETTKTIQNCNINQCRKSMNRLTLFNIKESNNLYVIVEGVNTYKTESRLLAAISNEKYCILWPSTSKFEIKEFDINEPFGEIPLMEARNTIYEQLLSIRSLIEKKTLAYSEQITIQLEISKEQSIKKFLDIYKDIVEMNNKVNTCLKNIQEANDNVAVLKFDFEKEPEAAIRKSLKLGIEQFRELCLDSKFIEITKNRMISESYLVFIFPLLKEAFIDRYEEFAPILVAVLLSLDFRNPKFETQSIQKHIKDIINTIYLIYPNLSRYSKCFNQIRILIHISNSILNM